MKQIDEVDDDVLELNQDWSKFYWLLFDQECSICLELITEIVNHSSRIRISLSMFKTSI